MGINRFFGTDFKPRKLMRLIKRFQGRFFESMSYAELLEIKDKLKEFDTYMGDARSRVEREIRKRDREVRKGVNRG